MKELYPYIYKRKSFHLFSGVKGNISDIELNNVKEYINNLKPLFKNIKTCIKIVPENETTSAKGSEFCILFYSQQIDGYLQNIGYMGEQLDLYLSSLNIGTLWFGMGKVKETKYEGLDYVIMICMAKYSENDFRNDMFKSKRKKVEEMWTGSKYLDIANIVRFCPSACNSQPWKVEESENRLDVYRYRKPGKCGIIPVKKINYFNKIDIGIFMLFLDVCLENKGLNFRKEIFIDNNDDNKNHQNATYYID